MFRDSASIREGARMRRFASDYSAYQRSHDHWFDGTVGSCDRRLAKIDALLAQAADSGMEVRSGRLQAAGLVLRRHQGSIARVRDELLNGSVEPVRAPTRVAYSRLSSRAADWVNVQAREFIAAQNTRDREELAIRSRRYASDRTGAVGIVEAFVARVDELASIQKARTAAAPAASTVPDFDDSLLTI